MAKTPRSSEMGSHKELYAPLTFYFIAVNWGSYPKSLLPVRNRGLCLMQYYLGPHECPRLIASHFVRVWQGARMWQTDTHTDEQTDRPRYGNMCSNRWNCFQRYRLVKIRRLTHTFNASYVPYDVFFVQKFQKFKNYSNNGFSKQVRNPQI